MVRMITKLCKKKSFGLENKSTREQRLYILVWSFPITSSESSRYPSSLSFSTAIAVMTLEMSPMGNLEDEVAENPAESWPYPVGNTHSTIDS